MSKKLLSKRDVTPYQVETYQKLVEIAGFCSESQNLRSFGLPVRALAWNVGSRNRSPRRNQLLVMADLATEMGLQVYRIKRKPVSTLVDSAGYSYDVTDKN